MMQKTKGFTLIELLVVIAIIGILSGLIIVSMGGAQNSAKDARIKSAMDQFRSTSEIAKFNNSGKYGTTTFTVATGSSCGTPGIPGILLVGDGLSLCNDIQSQASTTLSVYSDDTAYCIQKVLNGTSPQTWCLDSTGFVGCIGSGGNCGNSYNGCTAANIKCK